MEPAITSAQIGRVRGPRDVPAIRWGVLLALAGAAVAAAGLTVAPLGLLALAAIGALLVFACACRWPFVALGGLLIVAPVNYGFASGGASIKLSELVVGLMGLVILARAAAMDRHLFARAARTGVVIAALLGLAVLAAATAAPWPNFFNVRYEIQFYIVFIFTMLFFRAAWWRPLLLAVLCALAIESAAALALRFVYGLTGTSFFDPAGPIRVIQFTQENLETLAGGRFRLSGTFGHKNLLGAYYVLLLPVILQEILRRRRFGWLIVAIPSLVVLVLTDSMTAWGAIILIAALILVHLRRFDYLALLTLLVLPVFGVGLYEFGDSVFFRIKQLLSGQGGWGTISGRSEVFTISRKIVAEYPWAGIGRNNYLTIGRTFYGHAHNLFLMKMIEMGVPAGLAYTAFIVTALARPWRTILRERERLDAQRQYYRALGLWLGCLGFLAVNMFDYSYSNFALGALFMGMLGILMAVSMDLESLTATPRAASDTKPSSV